MEYGFFEYICEFWDEESKKIEKKHGVVYSNTFKNAMRKLEKYYDHIESIFIQGLEPFDVYEFENDPISFSLTVNKKE